VAREGLLGEHVCGLDAETTNLRRQPDYRMGSVVALPFQPRRLISRICSASRRKRAIPRRSLASAWGGSDNTDPRPAPLGIPYWPRKSKKFVIGR
jgi:hypothetical protein